MEQKDLSEVNGKKVKIIVSNNYYYKGLVLSIGEDHIKIRDINDRISFIVLAEIKFLEILK